MDTDRFEVCIKTEDIDVDIVMFKQDLILQIMKLKDHYLEEKLKK